jgi:hypothetical protein
MRLPPLPSLTNIAALLASMAVVLTLGIGAPGNWALGMLVGILLGLLLIAQGRKFMERRQEWLTSTYLPSRRTKDYHDLAMRTQNGDVPARVAMIINAATIISACVVIIAFLWLLLPAIFSRNMAGYEVSMRGAFAGMIAASGALIYLAGSATDVSQMRGRRIAGGVIAILCYLAWHYHNAADGL